MSRLIVFTVSGIWGLGVIGCDKNGPIAPSEFLNISGHWTYTATFNKGDSIWYMTSIPVGGGSAFLPRLEITSSGNSFAGTFSIAGFRRCSRSGCEPRITQTFGGSISGVLTTNGEITFAINDIYLGEIKHTGFVNIIKTDLPSGKPIRMRMSGTAEVVVPSSSVGRVTGFFHADRLVYE